MKIEIYMDYYGISFNHLGEYSKYMGFVHLKFVGADYQIVQSNQFRIKPKRFTKWFNGAKIFAASTD